MSISISIDNDRVTAGIQSVLDDESAGVQTPISTDDGNEIDVTLSAGLLGGFLSGFNSFLNSTMFGSFALSTAQKEFARDHDGASSSLDFVKVTTTNNETVSDLFFSDAAGNALDGDQAVGMQTLDGQNVYLWSNGDYCIATTSATAGAGRIVAAFYLNELSDHLTAQVQMTTFEPLSHPNASDPDDQLNFTNILQVSAAGSQSFDFDALKSSGALWVAVGNNQTAIVVSGYSLDVDAAGKIDGTSNKIAVSQGGTGTTIGLNNQLFDNVGERAVFTLVNGLDSLTSADGGILSDYIVDHSGPAAEGLNYTGYINVVGAGIFLSQSQGTPTETKDFDIDLYHAGGAGNVPEVGFNYIGTEPSGAFLDDTTVNAATVTIRDDDGNLVATWVAGADPDGAGPLLGSGATIHHVSTASGAPGNNVTVTITGGNIDIGGVLGGYTVSWTSAGGVPFNRFTLKDEGAGKFDVGRVDLLQGVSSHTPVGGNLIVEDDGPSITASITGAPSPTVDETNLAANDSDSFAAQFSPVYGTDGPAATPVTYGLSTPGGDSGLIDTATGNHVFLFLESGQVVGRQGTSAGTAATGDIVFVVSVNSAGSVTLDQQRAIVHPTSDPDESKTLSSAGLVVLTATAHDGDGDAASVPLNIGTQLIFKDDGPSITASIIGAPSPTVDESNLAANDSDSFAAQFSPVYGADGQAATPVTYALSTPGGDSGLIDTATGNHVFLFLESGQVVGRQGTNAGTAATGDIVFVVGVNSAGSVSLDQQRAIVHPTSDPDESKTLASAGLVVLTATAHDKDGDSASTPLDIGTQLTFKDDGPSITASLIGAPSPTVDESNLAANDSDSFAAQFSPVYGADGQAATPVTYALSTPGGDSGLVDTATGNHVFLFLESGQVVGRQGTDATAAASGDIVFVVGVDASGNVALDQQRAIVHPTSDPDESKTLASAGLVVLTATAYDKDGDSASAPLNIGTQLIFKDDGPSITGTIISAPSVTVDESAFATDGTGNFSLQFSPVYGADGQGATPVTYALSTPGGNSGLLDTATGNAVFLFLESGKIVGREGTSALDAVTGDIVLEISVSSAGVVTLDEKRAVIHLADSGTDQPTTMSSAGLVVITATAHDKDGDSASTPLNIGTQFIFKDDAPTITAQILGGTLNFVDDAFVTHSLNGAVNADVITNVNSLSQAGVKEYTITGFTDAGNAVYPNLDGVLSADGTKVTYYSTNVTANQNVSTAVYELTLDQSGAGAYTFTILQAPPITQTHFNFTDLPSGQNLFGIVATDKADLTKGGLLVFPTNPVLDANGQFTNVSGTINTSKGGGPVTIGNGNQAFDNPSEGAWFMYVDNPTAVGVGGVGLTQTGADDADNISFNGTNEATHASVSIVQASGSGTAKRPGPALHITAYEATPGHVDSNTEARNEVINPTLAIANGGTAAAEVDIIGIKIHDSTGAVIEYQALNQSTGVGALQDINGDGLVNGSDDSLVGIQFILDDPKGAGTADDIYSATISNLKAGYSVEFITATNHNLAQVQNVSGSYDIGGFDVFGQVNVAAQDFHFSVQITDYDNDVFGGPSTSFANFDVHVNELVFL